MTAISVDGQTCYKSLGSHAWFDTLAQFSVGIPNYLRYFDERGRNKPSYIRVHNPQTLIIVSADEKPAMTLLRANGKFDMRQPKQAPPVNPNPPGSMIGGNPPTGMMGGAGMTGMDGGMPPANNMRGGTAPMPMPVMPPGSPMPMPISPSVPPGRPMPGGGTSGQSTYDPNTGEHFTAFQGGFVPPQVIQPMPGGPRPMPGGDPQPVNMQGGTPGAMMGQMTGGAGMMGQTGMTGGNPMSPPPQPANPRDEMYLTVKVGLKAALDKVEQKAADAKEKILFSSATDMDANRIDLPDVRNAVVRMPRQFWDVTLLLYERKPFIRTLGVALIQKETLKYQFRNEIICGDDIAAKEFENDLRDRISPQVVKFIYAVSKHEVTLPNATKKADPDAPPNPVPPEGGAAQPEEKKPQDINSSQITVEQEYASVRFILDLMLDNPALMQVQGLAALTAGTLRVEMEAAASPSLRHGLAAAGKVLGEKGTSDRQVPEGTWPPGAFRRESDKRDIELRIDREPGRRISWMAALLPHMGHQNLYNRLNFRQSWRDPGNWSAGNKLVPQFLDPRYPDYARFVSVTDIPLDFAATHYVGIAGVGLDAASYRAGDPATAHKRGILSYEGSASMDNVRQGRGLANTMLMIQIPHDGITGVSPWIAGGGATLRGVPEKNSIAPFVLTTDRDKKTINHDGKRGTFVLMADGSVRFVDQNVKDEVFKAMATIGGPAPEDFNLDKNEHTPLLPPPDPKDKEPAKKPVVQPPVKGDEDKKPAGGANIDQIKAALQGTWIAKSAKIDGKDAPAEFLKILQTTFKGDTITTLDGKGNPEESPYTIDVTKTPFQLEFKAPSETGPTLCVFELAGGELRVCARGPEFPGGRPTSFSSTLGSGLALIVFTKQ
jgi:uncharacterized protein (TIGR03067 family)